MTLIRTIALCLTMLFPGIAHGRASEDAGFPDLCLQAARYASEQTGVPLRVLTALSLTETGRITDGELQPWPWTLNEAGDSHWFDSQDEALDYLSQTISAGTTNVDVGCFQLNFRWHGEAFSSLDQMMDPRANALYAARLMAEFGKRDNDWIAAAGAYHSGTPDVAERYLARFEPIYQALDEVTSEVAMAAPDSPRQNGFPLLMRGLSGSAGSIVPMQSAVRPLIGGP